MSLTVDISLRLETFTLNVSFTGQGGVTGLFGASGAGKTTIAHAVAGLINPDRGRITLDGVPLFDSAANINVDVAKRRIGYVFQDARLFPHMSVARNIGFGQRFLPRRMRSAQSDIIDILGIVHLLDRKPGTLSGGERQRVAIARALAMQPRLLIMDEPLAALDLPRKEEVLPYLERLCHGTGVPILYVSHAVSEMARLADHMVILRSGEVVRTGRTEDILSDPAMIPVVGVREAGSVLSARVLSHEQDGLSRLALSAGELWLAGVRAPVGTVIRVRVPAQDVILSLTPPEGLSSHNVLPVEVLSIRPGEGPGMAVQLGAGEDRLLARVTARAVRELDLRPGMKCHAVLNATAVPRGGIGSGY